MENKTRLNIVIACFAGAFIGAMLGLELAVYSRFLWIPSALVGGVIAYLTYNLREVGVALRQAWISVVDWRPDRLRLAEQYRSAINWLTKVAYIFLFFVLWSGLVIVGVESGQEAVLLRFLLFWFGAFAVGFWMLISTLQSASVLSGMTRWVVLIVNPVVLLIAIIVGMLCMVAWSLFSIVRHWRKILRGVATAVLTTGRLIKRVFVLIHSDVRTICLVDATIGATVGYFLASAWLGGAIGAAAGLINYEFISIRWLKLAPAHARH